LTVLLLRKERGGWGSEGKEREWWKKEGRKGEGRCYAPHMENF